MRVELSIYERLVNALGRVEYKRTDDHLARDARTVAALREVLEPALATAREAGRREGEASGMVSGIEQCAKLCPVCKGTGLRPAAGGGLWQCGEVQCRAVRMHLTQVRRTLPITPAPPAGRRGGGGMTIQEAAALAYAAFRGFGAREARSEVERLLLAAYAAGIARGRGECSHAIRHCSSEAQYEIESLPAPAVSLDDTIEVAQ